MFRQERKIKMNQTDLMTRLLRYTNDNFKRDINYEIALQLLINFDKIPDMSLTEIADLCYVSNASISRFVRHFGFTGFTDFKEAAKKALSIDTDYSREITRADKENLQPIYRRYTDEIIHNLEFAYEHIDFAQLDRVCKMIQDAPEVCVFGLEFSTLMGQHFQSRMAMMHKLVKIGLTTEKQEEIARSLPEGAVILIASMEGGYFYRNADIIDILKRKNIKCVTITMHPDYKLMDVSDEIMICGEYNNNTEGRVSLLYLIEIVIMHYRISYYQIESEDDQSQN